MLVPSLGSFLQGHGDTAHAGGTRSWPGRRLRGPCCGMARHPRPPPRPRSLSAPRSPAPACQDAAAARPGRKAAAVPPSPALGLCDMKSSASSALPPAPVAVSLLLKFCNWLPLSRAMRKTCVFVFNKYANVHFHVQEFLIMTAEELEVVPADA